MAKKRILLIEPDYKNKYPPLGLMKIATAHKLLGDDVVFYKGTSNELREQHWDKIYITTLFTFQWKKTIEVIKFWKKAKSKIEVGGILASLLPNELKKDTGIKVHVGPYVGAKSAIIKKILHNDEFINLKKYIDDYGVDSLPPDYGIFANQELPYQDFLNSSYILRATKGCKRGCSFCAVPTLEPKCINKLPLKIHISYIDNKFGAKQNLILLDDNVLASTKFHEIIDEIVDMGFNCNSKCNGKKRIVDFNQGLDVRLLTKKHLKSLSRIPLRPLRLAFDNIQISNLYRKKVLWAIEAGFTEISSYLLYNYNDSPSDLYKRIEIACDLNEKYGCRIYSFPMKYIPCNTKDRNFIDLNWTKRQIRGIQCILNATHGIAPVDSSFLRRAFGKTCYDFERIIQMPENYIIKRQENTLNKNIDNWNNLFSSMNHRERTIAKKFVAAGKNKILPVTNNFKINNFLQHYQNEYET